MQVDVRGLALSTDSVEAAAAYDRFVAGYLGYRADTPARLAALLQADPEFALAHCMQGTMAMLAYKQAAVPLALQAAQRAEALAGTATERERRHIAALQAMIAGDLDQAIAAWEAILAVHPLDAVALRLSHFINFWLGRPQAMAASIERAIPAWSENLPAASTVLACRCFAQEESGNYAVAEPYGRRAIEIDPGDLWAAHAVAHVLEMQGRRAEGIAWLTGLSRHWDGANNLMHHLWWHCALFHLEQGDFDTVLDLYDRRFRNLESPLTQALPDQYIDVQNATSMLFRLQRLGVPVGGRWEELADKAEARIGDCLSAFTLPHWMLALLATGRTAAAARLVEGMRQFAKGSGTVAPIVRDAALPIAQAQLAHAQGRHREALSLMRPALEVMYRLGGSHAQQDVLEQLYLEMALKADSDADLRLIVGRVASRRAIPLQHSIGWRDAAGRVA